jgi:hypothetical protein
VKASTAELKSPDDQCNQSAPLLTHVSLRMSKHQQLFRVGSTILGGHNALLTRLKLERVLLVTLPSFLSLRRLDLKYVTLDSGIDSSVRCLRSNLSVEILTIAELYLYSPHRDCSAYEIVDTQGQIELPKLKVLQVKDDALRACAILRSISYPTLALHMSVISHGLDNLTHNNAIIFDRCLDMWHSCSPNISPLYSLILEPMSLNSRTLAQPARVQLGHAFTLDEEGQVINSTTDSGDALSSSRYSKRCIYCSTTFYTSFHESSHDLGYEYMIPRVNRVGFDGAVDQGHLNKVTKILEQIIRRAANGPTELVMPHLIDCSDQFYDYAKAWMNVYPHVIKGVACAQSLKP